MQMSILIVSLLTVSLLSAQGIDAQMTEKEKTETGLYKLNVRQKAALQAWIDHHYVWSDAVQNEAPQTGMPPSATPRQQTKPTILSENLMNSRFLRLSDQTLWSIRPEDVPIAQGWITPVEIIVTQSSDPFYPSKLTNSVTGSSVLARQVEQLPSQPTQSQPPAATGG